MLRHRAATAATLYDKLWSAHVVAPRGADAALLYIDRMILHKVSSPQAFAGLERAGRAVRRLEAHLALVVAPAFSYRPKFC